MVYLHKKSHPYNCLVPVHKLTGMGDTTATSTGPSGDGTNPSKIKKGGDCCIIIHIHVKGSLNRLCYTSYFRDHCHHTRSLWIC